MGMFLETGGADISPQDWKLTSGSGGLAGELGLAASASAETVVPTIVAIIAAVFYELSRSNVHPTEQLVVAVTEKYASQFHARDHLSEQLCRSLPELWLDLCEPSGAFRSHTSFFLEFAPDIVTVRANDKVILKPRRQAPWEFLEFLLMHPNLPIHWLWGFVIFSSWRSGGKVVRPRRTLKTHLSRVSKALQGIDPQLTVTVDNPRNSDFWTLTEASFRSNVAVAGELCAEAEQALGAGDLSLALRKASEALEIHSGNAKAVRLKASCLIRAGFESVTKEELTAFFRQLSRNAIDHEAAVHAIDALGRSIVSPNRDVVAAIEHDSRELNDSAKILETLLERIKPLPSDYLEGKKFISLARDLRRYRDHPDKKNDVWQQIRRLPFVGNLKARLLRTLSSKTHGTINNKCPNDIEEVFAREFWTLVEARDWWPFHSAGELVKYFSVHLERQMLFQLAEFPVDLTDKERRLVRQYRRARDTLVWQANGYQPSNQELRDHLGWDEETFWDVHDLAQFIDRQGKNFSED